MVLQELVVYDRGSTLYGIAMDDLMPNNGLSIFLLAVLLLGVVFLLQWAWRRPLEKELALAMTSDSRESEVTARALMTAEEAMLFNLIRLAAQDYFLVLAKLPVLQVISVADKDEAARKALMRTVQRFRLDVVLAHPGTLETMTIVKFQKNGEEGKQPEKREQVVDTVLKAAGINVVVLDLTQTYSVEHVTKLLGLAEDE